MKIDLRPFSTRNLWPMASGELAVRPGLRKIYAAASGRKIVGSFSARAPITGDWFHYLVDIATSGALSCKARVLDQAFGAWQTLDLNADVAPRVVTFAVNRDQLFIGSPDLPTVWGWVGGATQLAIPGTPVLSSDTALPIPRGLVLRFYDRICIAQADSPLIWISDPWDANTDSSSLRAFTAREIDDVEGNVYGFHTAEGGSMVAVTDQGVKALSADLGQVGEVIGMWRTVDHYKAKRYGVSTVAREHLYGLTEHGYRRIDGSGTEETLLDDPAVSTVSYQRIRATDYSRSATMHTSEQGPVVALPMENTFYRSHSGFGSWWTMTHAGETGIMVGMLRDQVGDMIVTEKGVYRVHGNFDGDAALTENASAVEGGFVGRWVSDAARSPVVRRVDWQTDAVTAKVAIDADQESAAVTQTEAVIGTDRWDDDNGEGGTLGVRTWRNMPLTSSRFHFAARTDDVDIEAVAQHPLARVGLHVDAEFRGVGRRRP